VTIKPLDLATANRILDLSGGKPNLRDLGKKQLEGAVALHNMIANPRVGMGYLADEVGMGKTYVALAVVALLRYFNPALRVLYICPSRNVQEKWYSREYRSFTGDNVRVGQFRIRTPDGKPAAPRISCHSVKELIQSASGGYYADYFVGKGAFSMSLNEDPGVWSARLRELKELLPARTLRGTPRRKLDVKEEYARALNYVLPTFDLLVIDEAHNFKHGFDSSDRNRVLSAVLGFRDTEVNAPRIQHALLLSATPYDRQLEQLRNQLRMVGKQALLPDDVEDEDHGMIRAHLGKFMVRRLNSLSVAGRDCTRNMYRKEWRSGEHAEIALERDEQKLVTALVQKKVGDMLGAKQGGASFQTGLLASFESYAESTRSPPVEFDGEMQEKGGSDAEDRHVVGALADSYKRAELGRTLPHPKMDAIARSVHRKTLLEGRKQIVFVRRVKSVKEIKDKLDDAYNNWLHEYLQRELAEHTAAQALIEDVWRSYLEHSRRKEKDISGGDFHAGDVGEPEGHQPPKNDTLFAWFFRGELDKPAQALFDAAKEPFTTPNAMRIGLSAPNQSISLLLEVNWARATSRYCGLEFDAMLDTHIGPITEATNRLTHGMDSIDQLGIFRAAQCAFLKVLSAREIIPRCAALVDHLETQLQQPGETLKLTTRRVSEALSTFTFIEALQDRQMDQAIFPLLAQVMDRVSNHMKLDLALLKRLDIHISLLSQCLRTGHGVIDLYISRLHQGPANLTARSRRRWMEDFADALKRQSQAPGFNTYQELSRLAEHFDLVIKSNLSDIVDKEPEEYRKYLSQMLNPVAPVVGAHGETVGSRSAQARKFRMPGYPLALISTDVFQEGEDLHTFCDSVVHYGLPNSPVSIEQKTGRVDRVASLAQRRLESLQPESDVAEEDLIQVTFPYVRESIELLQVRRLCHNINEFLRSLNDVSQPHVKAEDVIDTELELLDRSPIPEQITAPLRSPYDAITTPFDKRNNREEWVEDNGRHTQRIVRHVETLLEPHFGAGALSRENLHLQGDESLPVQLRLLSARSSGEVLLSASRKDQVFELAGKTRAELHQFMLSESWETWHRTYAVEIAHLTYQLHHDAEILIGDERHTGKREIAHFLDRFAGNHSPHRYGKPESASIHRYWARAERESHTQYGRWHAEIETFEQKRCLGLTFQLTETAWQRKHHIKIFEADGRCIFLSKIANWQRVNKLSNKQLLRLTWLRNAHVDLAEFTLDNQGNLVGRVVHPVEGLTYKEFMYCAYTLAVGSDRLEYLVQEPDVY
jgi:hypothetical protein